MIEFPYHRSIAPTLGVLLGLAIVETLIVHLLVVALWGWIAALILGLLDLSLIGSLLWLLRSIRRHPVTIGDGVLTMRIGGLRVAPIPLDRVAGLRSSWDATALKQKYVLNLALATWPNVIVDLSDPIRLRGREIRAVAHRLDDPVAFTRALER